MPDIHGIQNSNKSFRTLKTQHKVPYDSKALNIGLQTLQSWDPCVTIPSITFERLHGQTKSDQQHVF